MSYETYSMYRDAVGLTDYKVAKLAGFTSATFTEWKNGKYTPKEAKRTRNSASLEIKAFPGFFVSFLLEIDRVLEIFIAS